MGHGYIYGLVHFRMKLDEKVLSEFSEWINDLAHSFRFGIYIHGDLVKDTLNNFIYDEFMYSASKGKSLPFDIFDCPLSNECFDIFKDRLTGFDGLSQLDDYSHTRLSDFEKLLNNVVSHRFVQYIQIRFEDAHGHSFIKVYDFTIKSFELCTALKQVPNEENRLEIPAARFKIVKEL